MADDLLEIADELYALPLGDFTPARDARAKELKGTDVGAAVKRLKKPSTAAWVVNLLVRYDAEHIGQVLEVGAALREAQAAMSGEELRTLTRQRRQLTAAVTTRARGLAREHGLRVTDAVADQVEGTLTAAMVSEQCAAAVRSGLLVGHLTTTGLDEADVASAVAVPEALGFSASPREEPVPGPPQLHVVPDPDADAKALAAARKRLSESEDALTEAQEARDRAAAAVEQLRAQELQLQSEMEELRRRLAELEERYDETDDALTEAEADRDEAQSAVDEAASERDTAAAAVARLERKKG